MRTRPIKTISAIICAALIAATVLISTSFEFDLPKWFPFSTERSLSEWQDKIFKGRVIYKVERSGAEGVLHALSLGSASAIFYRINNRFSCADYPMMSWRWKVVRFPDKKKLDARQGIEKDDYAARVYVIFPSLNFMSSKALEYVWDESVPAGTICASPYSKNIKLMVVRSGAADLGKWVSEERNVLEDYRKAFGRNPALKVGAVALMSDADNSGDISEAYFDEINIGYK